MEGKGQINIGKIISWGIIIIAIIIGCVFYSKYSFGNFSKSVTEKGKTSFSRENKSYKIENKDYSDAMFSQTIEVRPNTAYRVSCKIKTENVENEKNIYSGGAQIAIRETAECSNSVIGTKDWQEVEFLFNSKNRTNVEIAFRLGGYEENSKGTAYFSDLKLETSSLRTDKKWNMACFIIKNIDVKVKEGKAKGKEVKLSMTSQDIVDMKNNMDRLPQTFDNLSKGKMDVTCNIIEIEEPLKTISYDKDHEYYIDPKDAIVLIEDYLKKTDYDYIFVATRLGDINNEILVNDWVGLGGMQLNGIGFSNIRLPEVENNYIYKYDSNYNTFPEEVFVHEFLHTVERNEKEYGNDKVISIHDYEKYGYKEDDKAGLKTWYKDYMQNNIENVGNGTGATENTYKSQPVHASDLRHAYIIENGLNEPQNIMEEIKSIFNRIKALFTK